MGGDYMMLGVEKEILSRYSLVCLCWWRIRRFEWWTIIPGGCMSALMVGINYRVP